ncbi:hemolysin family protein [Candidatus Woesearchaeota archaeon]|nr:hemolysin family protein [Candidatus Woesearchaeota archaeon]
MAELTTQIIFLITAVLLSGVFSSSEIAMFSLSELRIRHLVERGKKGALTLQKLKGRSHRLLITILIGNNVVNIGAAAVATALAITLFGTIGVGIATGVMTLIILVAGEIVPKAFATTHAEKIALFMAPIFCFLEKVLFPLVWIFDGLTSLFVPKGKTIAPRVTEEEVRDMVYISGEQGSIKLQEQQMIENIFRLDDTQIVEIMTARPDVVAFENSKQVDEVIYEIKENGYSRVPVFEGDLDNVTGILYAKDLLKTHGTKQLKELSRPAFVVPETIIADQLLKEFKRKKVHMAIVVNEHGTMTGLITIEDLLEEIVGEIYDETDSAQDITSDIKKLNDTDYVIRGKAEIDEVKKLLEINLGDDNATISGFIMQHLKHIPKEGEQFKLHGFKFIIKEVEHNRVEKVFVFKQKLSQQ